MTRLDDWHSLQFSQKLFYKFAIVLLICFDSGASLGYFVKSSPTTQSPIDNSDVYYGPDKFGSPHGDYDPSSFSIYLKSRPWYMKNGTRFPGPTEIISNDTNQLNSKLHPFDGNDRDKFSNEMMYVPPNYNPNGKVKTIFIIDWIPDSWYTYWNVDKTNMFDDLKCPVRNCRLTKNKTEQNSADLVIWDVHRGFLPTKNDTQTRPPHQLWAYYTQESPMHTRIVPFTDSYNWTITFKYDSTIVLPYGKWLYYDPRVKQIEPVRNYALNKTKKVAWWVSNCTPNNKRMEYAKELQKYIEVDIYGRCGTKKCGHELSTKKECHDMLERDYKFYLAFENSNCRDYITEKFFETGLGHSILPIVMGAPRGDYKKYAPDRSYLHVEDFKSPKELAEYLHILDKNDDLYNTYFGYKGTGEVVYNFNYTWCRVCAALYDDRTIHHQIADVNAWFNPLGSCTRDFWRDFKANKTSSLI